MTAQAVRDARTMRYADYLASHGWQALRAYVIKRDRFACKACGNRELERLHVHHNTYERRGRELDRDLVTLCYACHKALHRQHTEPWTFTSCMITKRPRQRDSMPAKVADVVSRLTDAFRVTSNIDAPEDYHEAEACQTCARAVLYRWSDESWLRSEGYHSALRWYGDLRVCWTCYDGLRNARMYRRPAPSEVPDAQRRP